MTDNTQIQIAPETLSYEGMLRVLYEYVQYKGSQKEAARMLSISPQYLCDILQGKKDITSNISEKLGYRRRVIYKLSGSEEQADIIATQQARIAELEGEKAALTEKVDVALEALHSMQGFPSAYRAAEAIKRISGEG